MKSLEIVNRNIESIHNQLNDYDEDDEEYGFYPSYDTLIYDLDRYTKIKQDLEVLEIIKEKKVDIEVLEHSLGSYSNDLFQALYCYNGEFVEEYHLTMEELLKLKQWLEENE